MEHANGAAPTDTADVPMPTVENMAPSLFRPSSGIGSADVHEITLMYLLHLTGSSVRVAPGALRGIALPAERVAQLSDSARRFLVPLAQPAAPEAASDAAAEPANAV